MSHLRDLLHGFSRPALKATPAAAQPVPHRRSDSDTHVATIHPPEFPIEEAHFGPDERLVYHSDPRSRAADRFRLLRMRLKEHWKAGRLKKLLITGPTTGDGKSTLTLNLATALSERGERSVLVIEADLHHSSLTQMLHLKPWPGLTHCLSDHSFSPLDAIRRVQPFGWHLLPAGESRKNTTELLQTPAFGEIMQSLAPFFDWILIDSPPVIPLTDAVSLQQHADGCLLVVRAGKTPREALEQTIALLGKNSVVGIVLNAIEIADHHYSEYYEGAAGQTGE